MLKTKPSPRSLFNIGALVLAAASAALWYLGKTDHAFVAVVAGCVCFFLGVRSESKARRDSEDAALRAGE
jgi:Flp pilus assembly protein TadB